MPTTDPLGIPRRTHVITLAMFLLASAACSPESGGPGEIPIDAVDMVDAAADAELTLDLTRDADPTTPPSLPRRALLIDYDMRDPVVWSGLRAAFETVGWELEYRRWYPHIAPSDSEPLDGTLPYGWIVLAAGSGPGLPAARMRRAEVETVRSFAVQGGTVGLLTRGGWNDSVIGENEWALFNDVLRNLEVPVRIERNSVIGEVSIQDGDRPPLHENQPWSYVGSLEWTVQHAVGFPSDDHSAVRDDYGAMALGNAPTLICDGSDVATLASTHASAIVWNALGGGDITFLEAPAPIAVAARSAEGAAVMVAPQSLFMFRGTSERASDEPLLEPELAEVSATIADGLIRFGADLTEGAELEPNGCHAGGGALFDVRLSDSDPDGVYPERSPLFEVADAPVGAIPAGATAGSPEASEDRGADPPWFEAGTARMAYSGSDGGPERLVPAFTRAADAGVTTFVVTVPRAWLLEFDAGNPESDPLVALAEAAEEAGVSVFLGVGWNELRPEFDPPLRGPLGSGLTAPHPLGLVWEEELEPLSRSAATLSALYPAVRGLSIDTELYGAEMIWVTEHHIFDDLTWSFIAEAVGLETDLDLLNRADTLIDAGLAGDAHRAMEDEVARRVGEVREAAQRIDADFEFVVYSHALVLNWFYRGLIRGLGDDRAPLTFLSYESLTRSSASLLAGEGMQVRLVGGVLGVRLRANDLGMALTTTAQTSDGYWLFTLDDFPPDDSSDERLHSTADEYWEAIRQANASLTE